MGELWAYLAVIALIIIFLPPRFDPMILLKEKREGWPPREERPFGLGLWEWAAFIFAIGIAVVALGVGFCEIISGGR
jgi:hypothetical protein